MSFEIKIDKFAKVFQERRLHAPTTFLKDIFEE